MIISTGTEKHFDKIDDKNSYQSENTGSILKIMNTHTKMKV